MLNIIPNGTTLQDLNKNAQIVPNAHKKTPPHFLVSLSFCCLKRLTQLFALVLVLFHL